MEKIKGKALPPVNDLDLFQHGFEFLETQEHTNIYYNHFGSTAWYIHHFGGDDFMIAEDETTRYFGPIKDRVALGFLCMQLGIQIKQAS